VSIGSNLRVKKGSRCCHYSAGVKKTTASEVPRNPNREELPAA
jgi:hypothetical protein